jgi:hypothetical protein
LVRLAKPVDELANQFVRVRLTSIPKLDLRRFEFDCDLTWYVFLLNADETIYGRYGGRDAKSADSRLSMKGLHYAMSRALEAHKSPPPPTKLAGSPMTPENLSAGKDHKGCIHCHNVKEFERAEAIRAGTWDRESRWVYPLPENIGIILDVDIGNRVNAVTKNSPADLVGLRSGDLITNLNDLPVASFADVSYALHKAATSGQLPMRYLRAGKTETVKLTLSSGWRKTNLTWRPSLLEIIPSVAFSGDDLTAAEKMKLGLPAKRAAFRQGDPVHYTLAKAGFQAGDIIVGFDDHTANGKLTDLLAVIRQNYLVGDSMTVHIFRNEKAQTIKLALK